MKETKHFYRGFELIGSWIEKQGAEIFHTGYYRPNSIQRNYNIKKDGKYVWKPGNIFEKLKYAKEEVDRLIKEDMKTKFTKGEWKISLSINSNENFLENPKDGEWLLDFDSVKIVNEKGWLLAELGGGDSGKVIANAKLIAEAPETIWKLHETTKKLQSLIDNDLIKGVGVIQTIKEMIRRNEDQIKKAT